jgi:hypothetical protein
MVKYIMKRKFAGHFMQNAGFDLSFRDCPMKGGTGGHPTCAAESVAYKLPPVVGMEFKWKIRSTLEKPKPLISNISRTESNALKSLKRNRDIRILPADKENCTVVMNETMYMEKLNTLLDSGVYEPLPKDLTSRTERKIQKLLSKHNQGFLSN